MGHTPRLEQVIPEGHHPMEGTHTAAVHEELGKTHTGTWNRVPHEKGPSGEECEEFFPCVSVITIPHVLVPVGQRR